MGFGLGAVTEFEGVRSTNTSDWDTYIQASGDFTKITERVEPLVGFALMTHRMGVAP